MEKHYFSPNTALASAPVFLNRDQQMLRLYYDICDYLGLSINQDEPSGPSQNNSSPDLEYLMAISG